MLTGYALRAKPLNEHTLPWYAADPRGLTHNPREALAFSTQPLAEAFAREHLAPDVVWEAVEVQANRVRYEDEIDRVSAEFVSSLPHQPAFTPSMRWLESEPDVIDKTEADLRNFNREFLGQPIRCGSITADCIEPGTGRLIRSSTQREPSL